MVMASLGMSTSLETCLCLLLLWELIFPKCRRWNLPVLCGWQGLEVEFLSMSWRVSCWDAFLMSSTAVKARGKLEKSVGKFPFILYGSQASFLPCVRSFGLWFLYLLLPLRSGKVPFRWEDSRVFSFPCVSKLQCLLIQFCKRNHLFFSNFRVLSLQQGYSGTQQQKLRKKIWSCAWLIICRRYCC